MSYHGVRYRAKKSCEIVVGYVCSHCRAVIIAKGTFVAKSDSDLEPQATKAVAKVFSEGMYALQNAHIKPYRLNKVYDFQDYGNTMTQFSCEGLNHSCPYCGKQELWQSNTDKNLKFASPDWSGKLRVQVITGIPEESRPVLIDSTQALSNWRNSTIDRLINEFNHFWAQNASEYTRLQNELSGITAKISELELQRSSLSSNDCVIQSNIKQKTETAKALPIFSAERRQINAEISRLKKELNSQEQNNRSLRQSVERDLLALEEQRDAIMHSNPGIMNKLNTSQSACASIIAAYRVE